MKPPLTAKFPLLLVVVVLWTRVCAWGADLADTRMKIPPTAPFNLVTGVVVDPQRCVVYLMNAGGGIDALDGSSGKLMWSTTQAAQPLLLAGKRLIAQAEPQDQGRTLTIVVLDVERDGAAILTATVPLPDGVSASIDQGPGSSFTAQAAIGGDQLTIMWRSSKRRVSGVATRGGPADARELQGAAVIDLKTGRVRLLPRYQAAQAPEALPSNVRRLVESGALVAPPRRAGDVLATIELGREGSAGGVIIRRRDARTGRTLSELKLHGEVQAADFSADGRFVLVSKPDGADASGLTKYEWAIYSLDTGERIGVMPNWTSIAPFFVCRGIMVYESPPLQRRVDGKWIEEPLELQAYDFKARSQVWDRPLRDMTFRGPSPPKS